MTHFLKVIMKCDCLAGQELTSQQEKLGFVTVVLFLIVVAGVGSHSFIHSFIYARFMPFCLPLSRYALSFLEMVPFRAVRMTLLLRQLRLSV